MRSGGGGRERVYARTSRSEEPTIREQADDPVHEWITRGLHNHLDPESQRHPTDEAISAIHRRTDSHSVEALVELIGHEIRTPLTVIKGSSRMLFEESERLEPDQVESVRRIHRNAVLAMLLVDRLAEVRRVDEGDVLLSRRPVDLVEYVHETVEVLHEAVLGTRPVSVETDGVEAAVSDIDARRVRQIIFNLLASAALNTPPSAPVNLVIRPAGDTYEIEVRDHGHGVAPEDAERLFDKFPRLDAVRQGPGIGLYVSRGLARAHGGDLHAVPTDGDGGIFILSLPASDEPPEAIDPTSQAP